MRRSSVLSQSLPRALIMGIHTLKLLFFTLLTWIWAVITTVNGFKPPGRFDIGPADLDALCPLVKEFGDTGNNSAPMKIKEAKVGADCVYFEWNSCPKSGKQNERIDKPCGWYEMKKCGKRRRRGLFTYQTQTDDNVPVMLDFIHREPLSM